MVSAKRRPAGRVKRIRSSLVLWFRFLLIVLALATTVVGFLNHSELNLSSMTSLVGLIENL